MKNFLTIVVLLLFYSGAYSPDDGFGNLRCGSDIPKAIIGRHMNNESVAAIESRHKDIGLKNLGGIEISDKLFSASWKICGNEYMLLEDGGSIVRDALKIPEHSKRWPLSIGECHVNGAKAQGSTVAILDNDGGKATLSAKAAWKIDERGKKFAEISTAGLLCSRDGIITEDGGH
jgi:hypothetical protein